MVFHFFFKNHQHVRNVVVTYCGITYMYYLPVLCTGCCFPHVQEERTICFETDPQTHANHGSTVKYLQNRKARGLIQEVKVLCVEWRRQDRSAWITGPRLQSHAGVSSMQNEKKSGKGSRTEISTKKRRQRKYRNKTEEQEIDAKLAGHL